MHGGVLWAVRGCQGIVRGICSLTCMLWLARVCVMQCAPHRTGPLCALCQGDYVLAGDQCESCGSTGANVVLLVLCTSVLLVGVVFVIRKATAHLGTRTSSKGSATKNENLVLALFKVRRAGVSVTVAVGSRFLCVLLFQIITNYLQVVSQLGGFEVPWGSMVSTLFSLSSSSSSAPVSASFLQCTLRLSPYSRFLVVAAAPVVGAIGLLAIPMSVHHPDCMSRQTVLTIVLLLLRCATWWCCAWWLCTLMQLPPSGWRRTEFLDGVAYSRACAVFPAVHASVH